MLKTMLNLMQLNVIVARRVTTHTNAEFQLSTLSVTLLHSKTLNKALSLLDMSVPTTEITHKIAVN